MFINGILLIILSNQISRFQAGAPFFRVKLLSEKCNRWQKVYLRFTLPSHLFTWPSSVIYSNITGKLCPFLCRLTPAYMIVHGHKIISQNFEMVFDPFNDCYLSRNQQYLSLINNMNTFKTSSVNVLIFKMKFWDNAYG